METRTTNNIANARQFTATEAHDAIRDRIDFDACWLRSAREGNEIVNYFVVTVDYGGLYIAE